MNEIKDNKDNKPANIAQTPAAGIGRKSVWEKFKDSFRNEDSKSVGDYVIFDVLVPAMKKTVIDMVTNGVNMLFYGGYRNPQNTYPSGGVTYRNYNQQYNTPNRVYGSNQIAPAAQTRLNVFDYRLLWWNSKGEADFILDQLRDILSQYPVVRVSDLFDLGRQQCPYTAERYGWTNLMNAQSYMGQDGHWYLDLPKAMPLD